MSTMNMWSNVSNIWPFPCVDPYWVDLSVGYSWSFWIANTTNADIVAGTLQLYGADASPTDWCVPGPFDPMDPVAGCSAIVPGVAEPGPVTVTITPEMPIRAHSVCGFSAPCPRQFFQLRGLPAGAQAFAIVGSLRRTNWDHVTPWGFIPQPMNLGVESLSAQLPAAAGAAQPQRGPQPQGQPPRRGQPAQGQPEPVR